MTAARPGTVVRELRDVVRIAQAHLGHRLELLGGLIVLRSAFEAAGVASLYPVLALLTAPESFLAGPTGDLVYRTLRATSLADAVLRAALVYAVMAGLAQALAAWVIVEQYRSIYALQVRAAEGLFRSYLDRGYAFFLTRRGSLLAKNITLSTSEFAAGVTLHLLFMASSLAVLAALLVLLLRLAPVPTLATSAFLAAAFAPLMMWLRRPLARWGVARDQAMGEWFATVEQALGGIKETKLHHMEGFFLDRFRRHAAVYARMNLRFQATSTALPNNMVQAGILLLLAAALAILLASGADVRRALPIVGLYYVAFSRMLPQVNALFTYWTTIRYYWPSVHVMKEELAAGAGATPAFSDREASGPDLRFDDRIALRGVGFRYPAAETEAVRELELSITRGARVAFVGRSGAGKTTVMDLLLGLLEPSRGAITVDGAPLVGERVRAWQRKIGFVPQEPHLFEASIAENVALGEERAGIDLVRVRRALERARLLEHVDALPGGVHTLIGGSGWRLSGGEGQRLSIARALYREPDVLVLDEATSALDLASERELNAEIAALPPEITVVAVSHRVHALQAFDRLYLLDGGALVFEGPYEAVMREAVRRYGDAFAVPTAP